MRSTALLSEKQKFLLKAILGTVLAINAGNYLAMRTDSGLYQTFYGDLNYWLFPLSCLVVMQWILSSDYLPKGWVIAGLIGCIVVIPVMGITYYYIQSLPNQMHYLLMILVDNFAKGFFATAPQYLLMRNKNGFWWVLANSIGWLLSALYSETRIHLIQPIPSIPLLQTLIYHTYYFPLGLMVGLSLYNLKTKSNSIENNGKEVNK